MFVHNYSAKQSQHPAGHHEGWTASREREQASVAKQFLVLPIDPLPPHLNKIIPKG
jgi:hypothetical protein